MKQGLPCAHWKSVHSVRDLMSANVPPAHAFFDLDGTLLPWDTQLLFYRHVVAKQGWRRVLLLPFLLAAPLAAVKILRSRSLKRLFLSYLTGLRREELEVLASEFAEVVVRDHIWPEMRAEVEARRADGCVLVLNTASPAFYAEPIARALGFDHCVATEVVVPPVLPFHPEIDGPNNKRAAKIDAMKARGILPADVVFPIPGSWAYTDSIVDVPLLECAEIGVLVHPKPDLAKLGAARGWRVVRPEPAVSPAEWRRAAAAMLLGTWAP